MEKFILAAITAILFAIVGIFFMPKLLAKMGQDISDTNKYANRMNSLILDTPNCAQFKNKFTELGRNASSMNGAFTSTVVKTKEAANKAGCNKP